MRPQLAKPTPSTGCPSRRRSRSDRHAFPGCSVLLGRTTGGIGSHPALLRIRIDATPIVILVAARVAVINRRANQCCDQTARMRGHVIDAVARRQMPDTDVSARNAARMRRGHKPHCVFERNPPRSKLRAAGATHEQPSEQQALEKRPALPVERERTFGTAASHEQTRPEVNIAHWRPFA